MSGPYDFTYITPEMAHKLMPDESVEEYRRKARTNEPCEVCGQPAWRLIGLGMCFSCTTGESDASDDYELIEPSDAEPHQQ